MKRWILEGEWSGYRSSQQHIVHRTIITDPKPFEKLSSIRYTDGTSLYLSVKPCKPRERVKQIHGYDDLIRKCVNAGVDSVDALYKPSPTPAPSTS